MCQCSNKKTYKEFRIRDIDLLIRCDQCNCEIIRPWMRALNIVLVCMLELFVLFLYSFIDKEIALSKIWKTILLTSLLGAIGLWFCKAIGYLMYCISYNNVHRTKSQEIKDLGMCRSSNLCLKNFTTSLEAVLSCAQDEKKNINDGKKSSWTDGQIEVVLREISEILSYALNGTVFYKYGEKQRMLESTYILTDSLERLDQTILGEQISELQRLYNRL